MNKIFIIAEVGINHNGDLDIVKKLIDAAVLAGCDAVKFQKRTIDLVYSREELNKQRESPWGTTNREQKQGLEFNKKQYDVIDLYCKEKRIDWLASAWDLESQLFLRQYNLKHNKVASAMLTNRRLLEAIAEEGRHTFISTGMSTISQIEKAVDIFKKVNCPYELMHCNSTYPTPLEDENLKVIDTLRKHFNCNIGYSGHESGIVISVAVAALGVSSIERHITLDRTMYGSDQAASLELTGLVKLVRNIRAIEKATGDGVKKISDVEKSIAKKLRKVDTL
jgi:N-acetylneuraminate synthase